LEKEFEDGHRGDLSKNSFTNAKQSEIRAKMPLPDWRGSRRRPCWESQDVNIFWGLQTWEQSVLENWINVSLTSSYMLGRGVFSLG
jgi:hypothetical protein